MRLLKSIGLIFFYLLSQHIILILGIEQISSNHQETKNTVVSQTNSSQTHQQECKNNELGQGSSCKLDFSKVFLILGTGHKCSECEAIDPVFDPAYNMKEIAKQSILLEEHLIQRNKRCRDCITKHFLHIIGLAEEAANMCSTSIKNFPLLRESIILYNELFKEWLKV